jgi:AcrR family transcriptional regulator
VSNRTPSDGRSTRWESHRRARRELLVDAALAAIRRHGPAVGMDEVATEAATSKTVLYRHFADKAQLYSAVCARVAHTLSVQLQAVIGPDARESLAAAIDVYLQLIESDPQVYRFVVHHPAVSTAGTDQLETLIQLIGERVADLLEPAAAAAGLDPALARPWGHGVVGLVRAGADPWLEGKVALDRAELSHALTDLIWPGLSRLFPAKPEVS